MGNWDYKKKDYEDSKITVPAGKHRVRMASVTPKVSRTSGNQMYEIVFDVSNFAFKIYYYLVFAPDNASRVNGSLGAISESFGTTTTVDPEVTPVGWVGAVGAANVKLDEDSRPKISYFIEKSKQTDLPAWVEKSTTNQGGVPNAGSNQGSSQWMQEGTSIADTDGFVPPFDLE